MELHQEINNELRFELIQITENNIEVFRSSMRNQERLSQLLLDYVNSYDNQEFTNRSALNDIIELVQPNSPSKNYYMDKLDKYLIAKAEADEYFQIKYYDLSSTISQLKRTLSPDYNILGKCDHFFLGMILKNDVPLICMSVRADKDYKNTIHMYIFRSLFAMIGDIILENPGSPNLSIALHSLCTHVIYNRFPNETGEIKVWSEPVEHMKQILLRYVKINQNENISFCGMGMSKFFVADEKFRSLWKQLI